MRNIQRTKWQLCLGGVAAMFLASVGVASPARPARADAPAVIAQPQRQPQTPTPTPAGNLVAQGRAKYDRACGRCHPGGEEDVGPRLTGINWAQDRMTRQIRNGGGRMRPIPTARLSDADLPALMAYMRTIHAVR